MSLKGPLGRSGLRVSAISYGAWLTVSETGAAPWCWMLGAGGLKIWRVPLKMDGFLMGKSMKK